jgi:hypothetical protein
MSADAAANCSFGVDGGRGDRAGRLRHRRQPLPGAGVHARHGQRAATARTAAGCRPADPRTTGFGYSLPRRTRARCGSRRRTTSRTAQAGAPASGPSLRPSWANRWAPRPIASRSVAAPSSTGGAPRPMITAVPRPTSRSDRQKCAATAVRLLHFVSASPRQSPRGPNTTTSAAVARSGRPSIATPRVQFSAG